MGKSEVVPTIESIRDQEQNKRSPISVFCSALKSDEAPRVDLIINVHGSVTYGAESDEYPCEQDEKNWWLGFDCAHLGDKWGDPKYEDPFAVFRSLEYCVSECEQMAEQIMFYDKKSKEER